MKIRSRSKKLALGPGSEQLYLVLRRHVKATANWKKPLGKREYIILPSVSSRYQMYSHPDVDWSSGPAPGCLINPREDSPRLMGKNKIIVKSMIKHLWSFGPPKLAEKMWRCPTVIVSVKRMDTIINEIRFYADIVRVHEWSDTIYLKKMIRKTTQGDGSSYLTTRGWWSIQKHFTFS